MWTNLAVVVLVWSVAYSTIIYSHQWIFAGQGLMFLTGNSNRKYARGEDACARACSQSDNSLAFLFFEDTNECQCHDYMLGQPGKAMTTGSSARYFVRGETSGFSCPPDLATSAINATLPGGTTFNFKTFLDHSRSFSDAGLICHNDGASLFQLSTRVKISFARMLLACPELQNKIFWIDGMHAINNQWITTDGKMLPLTLDVRNTDVFDGIDKPICVWMEAALGHKLQSRTCDVNIDVAYTLCETT